MNDNFVLMDKNNNIQKNATAVVKFVYEHKDYMIYSIPENEENSQVLTSKVILNSEGKYFIEDLTPEEKSKISNLVYNMVILIPTEAKKGGNKKELIDNFKSKYSVELSIEIPELMNQDYFSNCSIAITNKTLIEEAIKFYKESLKEEEVKTSSDNVVLTWTLPTEVKNNMIEENAPLPIEPIASKPEELPTNEINNTVTTNNNEPIAAAPINTEIPAMPAPVIEEPKPATVEVKASEVSNPILTNIPVETAPKQELNPQTEKLAVVSDPSINEALGVNNTNMQPNVMKRKAGFAINKYIVIGTLCILVAIVVVIIAYILIKKKTTGF